MKIIVFVCISSFLVSCVAMPANVVSVDASLTDSVLDSISGDLKTLYDSWIKPLNVKNRVYIALNSRNDILATELEIKKGFEEYCKKKDGITLHKKQTTGDSYVCHGSDEKHMGEFITFRHRELKMSVQYRSPNIKFNISDFKNR